MQHARPAEVRADERSDLLKLIPVISDEGQGRLKAGLRHTFNDCVDLDQLIDIAEQRDSEQGGRRHVAVEALGDCYPRVT